MPNGISMVKDEVIAAVVGFADVPMPMSISDPDGTLLAVNDACARLLGRPASELVGRTAGEIVPGMEYLWADIVAHAREYGSYCGEISAPTPQGPIRSRYMLWLREHAGRSYVVAIG